MSDPLAQLPIPGARRVAVRLTPDALRRVRAGHPWVFDGSIVSVSHEGAAGDLAVVFDGDRKFVAIGLYDPGSPIRVKILHVGRPVPIDADWWASGVRRALGDRRRFTDDPAAGELAYRIVNGENDGFPGLVVDRYAHVLVVKAYSAAWLPHLPLVVAALREATGCDAVVARFARTVAAVDTWGISDGAVIAGELAGGPVRFTENGLSFDADVRHGQKTGHFLDQRANRLRVGARSKGRDVLDVFASTGGFSVHAAAGGARSVHAVDLSAPTLAAAEHNMALNSDHPGVASCRFTTDVADAFRAMAALRRARTTYDLVVVDPPSFAQRAADVPGALAAYGRLTRAAVALVRPGGVLVQASCSSRVTAGDFYDVVLRSAADVGRPLREIERTGHDDDHPVGFVEGAYLKAGFWTVP